MVVNRLPRRRIPYPFGSPIFLLSTLHAVTLDRRLLSLASSFAILFFSEKASAEIPLHIRSHYVGQSLAEALKVDPQLRPGVHALMKGHAEGAWSNKYEDRDLIMMFAKDDSAWSVSGSELQVGQSILQRGMSKKFIEEQLADMNLRNPSDFQIGNVRVRVVYRDDQAERFYIGRIKAKKHPEVGRPR